MEEFPALPSPEPKNNKGKQVSGTPSTTTTQTQNAQCWQRRNKMEVPQSTFDFFKGMKKSHKEIFMLICLLSKQIFANLLK